MQHVRLSNRLKGFDYSRDQLYFITSCVQDRACVFGDVLSVTVDDSRNLFGQANSRKYQMVLNACGEIALRQWYWLEKQYPYVRLHKFVVMPNHIHGIIEINRGLCHKNPVGTGRDLSLQDFYGNLSVQDFYFHDDLSLQIRDIYFRDDSEMKIKSLSELIGAYKTTSSKHIHLIQSEDGSFPFQSFRWQRSFHDHIIRDLREYERITNYIQNNPQHWLKDKFYL